MSAGGAVIALSTLPPAPPDVPSGVRWARELSAGAAGALAGLAPVLTLGLLAYAALGPAATEVGIPAAFICAVIGGSVFSWLARGPMAAGGPSSAPVLILASLVIAVAADPAFHADRPADVAALLALTAAAVTATGVLQIIFALAGAVRAARFVPQPVLAGFMNGVAVIFITSQIPLLLGWPVQAWSAEGWSAFARVQPATLGIGVVTVAAVGLTRRLGRVAPGVRRLSATFVGLLVGCAAYAAVATLWPQAPLGELSGHMPPVLPWPDKLLPLGLLLRSTSDTSLLLHRHLGTAFVTALLLALTGTLQLVMNGLALDQALHSRTDPRRELLALGTANIVSGVFGGLPVLSARAQSLATHRAGGRTRLSLLATNALFGVLALFGGPLLALLPKVVLAGIMVTLALTLFDDWSLGLAVHWRRGRRSAEARLNLAIVAIVAATSVFLGFGTGVATGAVLAVAIFIHSMDRSLLRSTHTAAQQPSRRIYGAAHETMLQRLRPRIAILELEGALFFGSADRLAREADALTSDRGPACTLTMVMDFRRVGLIDASGAVVLSQISQRLHKRGVAVLLAGLSAGDRHGRALSQFAGAALPATAWYPDVDRAVEAAELQALSEAGVVAVHAAVPLAEVSLMAGLDDAQRTCLAGCLERRLLVAGERLFAQGDSADRLFVLTDGSISVVGGGTPRAGDAAGARTAPRRRYVTCSPGMMLGELAMLDGRGRSAEAVADTASEVFSLGHSALQGARRRAAVALRAGVPQHRPAPVRALAGGVERSGHECLKRGPFSRGTVLDQRVEARRRRHRNRFVILHLAPAWTHISSTGSTCCCAGRTSSPASPGSVRRSTSSRSTTA